MKFRVLNNIKSHPVNQTYIIMYRQPAPNPSGNNNGGEEEGNGNSVGQMCNVRTSNVPVPSVIGSLDVSTADMNSNMSVSSSDTEESGSYVHDRTMDTMDPLTVEAIKAIKSGKTRQRIRLEDLPPEEAQRRSVRRERNKQAAAKCRQRRVNQTNDLLDITGDLEETKGNIEQEIADLMQEKEQLEFILQAHKPACKLQSCSKTHTNDHSKSSGVGRQVNMHRVTIKNEPDSPGPSRPSTLPITSMKMEISASAHSVISTSAEAATGIPITTPSGEGLFNFTMDNPGASLLTPTCTGQTAAGLKKTQTLDTPSSTLNTPSSPTFLSL